MLTFFFANNYKSLVNFRVEFDRTNVLIGRNGSGKSAVLGLLASLQQFILGRGRTTDYFSTNTLTRWMKSSVQTFEFGVKVNDKEYVYHLELEYNLPAGQCLVALESVVCSGKKLFSSAKGEVSYLANDATQSSMLRVDRAFSGISYVANGIQDNEVLVFMNEVAKIVFCSINPRKMQDHVSSEAWLPDLEFSNIGSVFSFLAQANPDAITHLRDQLRQIDPSLERLKIKMGYGNWKSLIAEYRYHDYPVEFCLSELSEGERMVIALYILLFGYLREGHTVFIDEPDNYVSLREIQPWCIAVADACVDGGQCIAISHHPEVIDYFGNDNVIWISRLNSGESEIKKKPDSEQFKDFMKLSELITGGFLDENE